MRIGWVMRLARTLALPAWSRMITGAAAAAGSSAVAGGGGDTTGVFDDAPASDGSELVWACAPPAQSSRHAPTTPPRPEGQGRWRCLLGDADLCEVLTVTYVGSGYRNCSVKAAGPPRGGGPGDKQVGCGGPTSR